MSLRYIIDGYNLINHPLFSQRHKQSEDPRHAVLTFIKTRRLTGSPKNSISVVFDGYPPSASAADADAGIDVVFSRKINADDKIKNMVEESSGRKNIIVVSDDKEIKFMAESLGAHSLGIEEFIQAKEKPEKRPKDDLIKPELNYSQIHKINQELRRIWLRS
ncbi:MAG: NYN domain-containing protein [Candidatus Omnitrophota bacterium]|jgi:predicted RNA-binding protein with PIN domain